MLHVEHRDAHRLVALEQQVARVVAHAGEPAAGALRGGEAVQPVLLGAAGELVEQLVAGLRAVAQDRRGLPADPVGEPLPVAAELARRGVELAQRAVLGAVQPVAGDLHRR